MTILEEAIELFRKLSPEQRREYMSRLSNLVNDKEDMYEDK